MASDGARHITRRKRARVVELLRCAADECQYNYFPRLSAAHALDVDTGSDTYAYAVLACDRVGSVRDMQQLLEAALRVERGEVW